VIIAQRDCRDTAGVGSVSVFVSCFVACCVLGGQSGERKRKGQKGEERRAEEREKKEREKEWGQSRDPTRRKREESLE
jgi:hypothetical protein